MNPHEHAHRAELSGGCAAATILLIAGITFLVGLALGIVIGVRL